VHLSSSAQEGAANEQIEEDILLETTELYFHLGRVRSELKEGISMQLAWHAL
jgi:hypothetical protein